MSTALLVIGSEENKTDRRRVLALLGHEAAKNERTNEKAAMLSLLFHLSSFRRSDAPSSAVLVTETQLVDNHTPSKRSSSLLRLCHSCGFCISYTVSAYPSLLSNTLYQSVQSDSPASAPSCRTAAQPVRQLQHSLVILPSVTPPLPSMVDSDS